MFNIEEQLELLPNKPGVYLMKDNNGIVIYIGKSKNLKKRVSSYFRSFDSKRPKVQTMIKNIYEFEYFITDTELEALILESNLIKKNNPKFNILLRDDKRYPYIKVSLNEAYPRIYMTRAFEKDGSKYFGPYTSAGSVKSTINVINELFQLRTCKRDLTKKYERACINLHIGKCLGPCINNISTEEYDRRINKAIDLLNGNLNLLIKRIEKEMNKAAEQLNFEKAADFRDKLNAVTNLKEKQKINSTHGDIHDVISYYKGNKKTCIMVFFIRAGNIIGRDKFIFDNEKVDEVLTSFITQFYSGAKFIPKNILIKESIEDLELIEDWLTQIKGKGVKINIPKIGRKKSQIDLVTKNAKEYLIKFENRISSEERFINKATKQLKDLLNFDGPLNRLEAFDISNIYGVYSVGSMVVFENGQKKRNSYRRFKIKTVEGNDDYTSMQEIIYRRYRRGLEELKKIKNSKLNVSESKFSVFPDLILIDGGKGHVNVVQKVLDALALDLNVCGMIKDDYHRTKSLYYDGQEISFQDNDEAFKYIFKIQEEVHRFAINYHKTLRRKNMTKSILDEINGIGESRRLSLIKYFKSIDNIKLASIEELIKVDGISEKTAEKIFNFFNN